MNLLFKGSILITEEGVIDSHTHYQMSVRGADTADDFFTGSPSAVCGGVTTFIEYADLLPGGDLADSLGIE